MAIQTSEIFASITHHANLGTFLLRHDTTPHGLICSKIYREMDFSRMADFMVSIFSLCYEVGMPTNVEQAIIHYITYIKGETPTSEWNQLIGASSNIDAEVLASIPASIMMLLTPKE